MATRGLSSDALQLVLAEHQLIVGNVVLGELRRVLRQKLKVPPGTVDENDAFLRMHGFPVESVVILDIEIRDPADRRILSEAVAGNADVLVSGDRDLLELKRPPLRILDPRGFWNLLRGPATP